LTLLIVEGGDVALEGAELFWDVTLVAARLLGGGLLRLAGGWAWWGPACGLLALAVVDLLVDRISVSGGEEMVV
jgi:hypothetical protein